MSISTITKIDKFVSSTPSMDISEVRNMRAAAEPILISERAAGHPHPLFVGVSEERPMFSLDIAELDVLLGGVGVAGAALATGHAYLKLATSTGSVARATTSHERLTITDGIIFWESIELGHNGIGTASVIVQANYDGANAPILRTGSLALSGNLTAAKWFGAGPVAVNGTSVPGIQSISITSGVQLLIEGGESELYPTFVGLQQTDPTVTIRTRERVNWSTYGLSGTSLNGSTGITFYARKKGPTGPVADLTAEHIKFVGANGIAVPVDTSGEGNTPITDTLKFTLTAASDSTVPLTITTSSAIS